MRSLTAPLAVLVVAAVAYSAMNASRAGAAEARIGGFAFGCVTPEGETLKPMFGDIDGNLFIDLPAQRRVCLDTVDRIIARCGENTGFASNTEDRRHAGCLPVFERQAEACAAFFRAEKAKCDAGGDPEEVEGGLGLSREDRRLVQMGLSSGGYDPGPADGLIGERTREAIRRWQGSRGEAETGYLDADGAKELLGLGERAAARSRAEAEREAREAEARRERERRPGRKFRDCPECPELVVVPSGSFMMGSPASEEGRWDDEGPVRRVTIAEPFAVGVHEVTRGEFARFVSATGRSMGDSCWTREDGEWESRSGRHWRSPGFRQGDDHPVVCVSWNDARAYVNWLSGATGESYRLLSESEWEYAARSGTSTARYWGESESGQCRYANGADASTDFDWRTGCDDGYSRTAPVGSFAANVFGLHDMSGNVFEWVEDCWNGSYAGAPGDGSAWESGNCSARVLRGGSWNVSPRGLRSAVRGGYGTDFRNLYCGFRVARTLAR